MAKAEMMTIPIATLLYKEHREGSLRLPARTHPSRPQPELECNDAGCVVNQDREKSAGDEWMLDLSAVTGGCIGWPQGRRS